MKWKSWHTGALFMAFLAAIVGADVLLLRLDRGLTLSEWERVYGSYHWWISYGWGVVFGHWKGPKKTRPFRPLPLVVPGVVGIVCGFGEWVVVPWWAHMAIGACGVIAGALWWAQPSAEEIEEVWRGE